MYSVELRKKRCIIPDKWYEKKNVAFACLKHVNLDQLFLPFISILVQTQHFRESQIPKEQI